VVRIARAIRPNNPDGEAQVVFYDWGVATGNGLGVVGGGAFGKGIDRNIRDGYRFVIHNYAHGDKLWFFGFSRGAYTVRSLVGLIRNAGILSKRNSDRIPDAYALYRSSTKPDAQKSKDFRAAYSRESKIHFLGAFDTVGALGIPCGLGFGRRNEQKYGFHDTQVSSRVRNAYHALAIDEKRKSFVPTIWRTKPSSTTSEQAWFAGVHGDVGGDYPDTGLADHALEWLVGKAVDVGLSVNQSYLRSLRNPASNETLHNSYTLKWKPLGKRKRALLATSADEVIHPSARRRWNERPGYRPDNLRAAIAPI
jgi:uncharacterized protein (DUF2235 family)